jgi:hypothetical protein
MRSRWTWIALFFAAYCSSAFWYGRIVFVAPWIVFLYMPLGFLSVLRLAGVPIQDGGPVIVAANILLAVFWPLFLIFLWRLPRLSRPMLYTFAAVITLITLVTLGGCIHLAGPQPAVHP